MASPALTPNNHADTTTEESAAPVLKHYIPETTHHHHHHPCQDIGYPSTLMKTCVKGLRDAAEYLLTKNAEVNQQDKDGHSALFYAARGGHLEMIKLLIRFDACVYLRDNENGNVVHHLIREHRNMPLATLETILKFLVEQLGLSITAPEINGTTALHEACRQGLPSVARYLIERGSSLKKIRNGWERPVWSYVIGGSYSKDMIPLLLEKGETFESRHCVGLTLVQYASLVRKCKFLVEDLQEAQKDIKMRRMKDLREKRKELLAAIRNKMLNGDGETRNGKESLEKWTTVDWKLKPNVSNDSGAYSSCSGSSSISSSSSESSSTSSSSSASSSSSSVSVSSSSSSEEEDDEEMELEENGATTAHSDATSTNIVSESECQDQATSQLPEYLLVSASDDDEAGEDAGTDPRTRQRQEISQAEDNIADDSRDGTKDYTSDEDNTQKLRKRGNEQVSKSRMPQKIKRARRPVIVPSDSDE